MTFIWLLYLRWDVSPSSSWWFFFLPSLYIWILLICLASSTTISIKKSFTACFFNPKLQKIISWCANAEVWHLRPLVILCVLCIQQFKVMQCCYFTCKDVNLCFISVINVFVCVKVILWQINFEIILENENNQIKAISPTYFQVHDICNN